MYCITGEWRHSQQLNPNIAEMFQHVAATTLRLGLMESFSIRYNWRQDHTRGVSLTNTVLITSVRIHPQYTVYQSRQSQTSSCHCCPLSLWPWFSWSHFLALMLSGLIRGETMCEGLNELWRQGRCSYPGAVMPLHLRDMTFVGWTPISLPWCVGLSLNPFWLPPHAHPGLIRRDDTLESMLGKHVHSALDSINREKARSDSIHKMYILYKKIFCRQF
jgi:hypothetical protein